MVNDKSIDPEECITFVELYFKENFNNFTQLKKIAYTGYWWIEYSNNADVKIIFDGDIGGHFSIKVNIGNTEYFLWQFDKSVNQATKSTNENLLYQLNVLKIFLDDNK